MRRATIAVLTAGIALLGVAAGYGGGSTTTLRGTVGPGYTIKLTKAGAPVKSLAPGTYTFVVADRSAVHSFVLERKGGPERALTTVPFMGTKTVTVKLTKGTWKFYCAAHSATMVGRFGVGQASPGATTTTPTTTTAPGTTTTVPGYGYG